MMSNHKFNIGDRVVIKTPRSSKIIVPYGSLFDFIARQTPLEILRLVRASDGGTGYWLVEEGKLSPISFAWFDDELIPAPCMDLTGSEIKEFRSDIEILIN